jgi:hypothetical protein
MHGVTNILSVTKENQETTMSEADDKPGKGRLWAGRLVSALPVLGLLVSASMKLSHAAPAVEGFVSKFGYPESAITPIGAIELLCAILYAVPQTSVLGAILITGYLGGATATHVRVGDPFIAPVILGVIAWLGLWLRDGRLAALAPLRKA